MRFNNYHFRFSLLGTILALIGLLIFSTLGTWQVFRAIEKEGLQLEMDNKKKASVFYFNKYPEDIASKTFLNAEVEGHYDTSNEILIDNMVHNGSAGYHVLTPFILQGDNSVILVNRGWVPVGKDRNILPDLDSPSGMIKIHGIISQPRSKPPIILAEPDSKSKVWLYFDESVFEKMSGSKVMPVVILLSKEDEYGYVRVWPKYEAKVGMHIGYAIQWYVFALIVIATYLGVNFKKRNPDDRATD